MLLLNWTHSIIKYLIPFSIVIDSICYPKFSLVFILEQTQKQRKAPNLHICEGGSNKCLWVFFFFLDIMVNLQLSSKSLIIDLMCEIFPSLAEPLYSCRSSDTVLAVKPDKWDEPVSVWNLNHTESNPHKTHNSPKYTQHMQKCCLMWK